MIRRSALVAAALALAAGGTAEARTIDVKAVDFRFQPAQVTAHVGDVVRWTNVSRGNVHSVSVLEGRAVDHALKPGESYSWTVTGPREARVVRYTCRPHEAAGMKGTIRVVP